MATVIDPELRTKIDTACRMEEEFHKLYNEKVVKKRHQMTRLYMDNGLLVWNGNGANGKDNIQKYFQELPRFEHPGRSADHWRRCVLAADVHHQGFGNGQLPGQFYQTLPEDTRGYSPGRQVEDFE